jgi:hypothetical protein
MLYSNTDLMMFIGFWAAIEVSSLYSQTGTTSSKFHALTNPDSLEALV